VIARVVEPGEQDQREGAEMCVKRRTLNRGRLLITACSRWRSKKLKWAPRLRRKSFTAGDNIASL